MAGRHVSLLVHFVWSTAGREPWISHQWKDELYGYIGGVIRNQKGRLLAAGGTSDHIHLCTSLPTTLSLAATVNALKANSSRWIHQSIPRRRGFAWQRGYAAFSVSKSVEDQVIAYIRGQEAHHRRRGFREEFVELLERHRIEYDEQHLWD